jgi:hypothetical protein
MDFLVSYIDRPEYLLYFVVAWLAKHQHVYTNAGNNEDLARLAKQECSTRVDLLCAEVQRMHGQGLVHGTGLRYEELRLVNLETGQFKFRIQYPIETVNECLNNRLLEDMELRRIEGRMEAVGQIHSHMQRVIGEEARLTAINSKMVDWEQRLDKRTLARQIQFDIPHRIDNLAALVTSLCENMKAQRQVKQRIGSGPAKSSPMFPENKMKQLKQLEDLESKCMAMLSRYETLTRSTHTMATLSRTVPAHCVIETNSPLEGVLRPEIIELQRKLKDKEENAIIRKYQKDCIRR